MLLIEKIKKIVTLKKKDNNLLSIAFLTKNEEEILTHILPNLVKTNLPIVVLDTGSTDNTKKYLTENNVTVYDIDEWKQDFSYARNFLLSKITTTWVLLIDADEYIEQNSFDKIKKLVQHTKENFFLFPIYQNNIDCFMLNTNRNYRVKLFRTDRNYKFIRPVNEDLNIDYTKVKKINYLDDYPIFHWGNDSTNLDERYKKKIKNYIEIFKNILKTPEYHRDAMLNYQLGNHLSYFNKKKEAEKYYLNAVRFVEDENWIMKFQFSYSLINIYLDFHKDFLSKKFLLTLEKKYKILNKALTLLLGTIYLKEHNLIKAKEYMQKSLDFNNEFDEKFGQYPLEIKGYRQYLYLGLIEEFLGNFDMAEKNYLKAQNLQNSDYVHSLLQRVINKRKELAYANRK